jgi:hypothetical protein
MGNHTSQYGQDFKADIVRSSFKWVIQLANGYTLTGYSRKEGKTEISDKGKLFMRKIIMLAKKDYFNADRVTRIEFFSRTSLGEFQEHLITLLPFGYELKANAKFNSHKAINSFLETFYNLVKSNNISQLEYSMVGYSKIKEEDIFKLESGRFKTIMELQKYCSDMIIEGYAQERVEHFQRQYKDKYLIIGAQLPLISTRSFKSQ